jgi:hypothetical protein
LSATSLLPTEPAIRFACLPLGGWCPEIVFGPTWLLEETTYVTAVAVPPRATKSAASETTFANVR